MTAGVVVKSVGARLALYSCAFDATTTETKGTVLLKTASELQAFSQGEESLIEAVRKGGGEGGGGGGGGREGGREGGKEEEEEEEGGRGGGKEGGREGEESLIEEVKEEEVEEEEE